ncbi:MAG: hypothetical protein ABI414_14815, partial [Devosia sp.]
MSKLPKNALPSAAHAGPIDDPSDLGGNAGDLDELFSDAEIDALHRTAIGRPRMAWGSSTAFVRLGPALEERDYLVKRGDRAANQLAIEIVGSLSEPLALKGPASAHAIDELVATVFDTAPNFARPLEAIRQSAQAMVRAGAPYFQVKPLLIEAPPGCGKTSWAMGLAKASGLPTLYLDATAMTTGTPLVSADAVWSNARPSEIVQFL